MTRSALRRRLAGSLLVALLLLTAFALGVFLGAQGVTHAIVPPWPAPAPRPRSLVVPGAPMRQRAGPLVPVPRGPSDGPAVMLSAAQHLRATRRIALQEGENKIAVMLSAAQHLRATRRIALQEGENKIAVMLSVAQHLRATRRIALQEGENKIAVMLSAAKHLGEARRLPTGILHFVQNDSSLFAPSFSPNWRSHRG